MSKDKTTISYFFNSLTNTNIFYENNYMVNLFALKHSRGSPEIRRLNRSVLDWYSAEYLYIFLILDADFSIYIYLTVVINLWDVVPALT